MEDRSTGVRTPARHLRLVDVDGAAPDLIEFGRAYWDVVGVDRETEEILWKSTLDELFLVYGMSYHDVDVWAAAGVRAHLDGIICINCGAAVVLVARDDLQAHFDGDEIDQCVACDDGLAEAVARQRTERAAGRRAASRARSELNRKIGLAEQAWLQQQRDHVATKYQVPDRPVPEVDTLPVRVAVAALTMLRAGPGTPGPAIAWRLPLAPNVVMTDELLELVRQFGVLAVSPDSPLSVCRWEQKFPAALAQADNDPDRLPSPVCTGYRLTEAHWHIPGEGPLDQRRAAFEQALASRLTVGRLRASTDDCAEILGLTTRMIAAETLRAFSDALRAVGLPAYHQRHTLALEQTARTLAAGLDLLSCLSHAATAVQKAGPVRPGGSGPWERNQTIVAVHELITATSAMQSQRKRRWSLNPQHERAQLSAMTWQILNSVLGIKVLDGSRVSVAAALDVPLTSDLPAEPGREPAGAVTEPSDEEFVMLAALRAGWDHQRQLERRQQEWAGLTERARTMLQTMDTGIAFTVMAEVSDTLNDAEQIDSAWLAVRWLLHHPSEDAIVLLADFDHRFGPFNHPEEMIEAMIRMCVQEVFAGRGPWNLRRFSDLWTPSPEKS